MDLKDFQYLIALAEEGSVSRAADRLFMSQSSLSQFLTQAENELGVRLFIRTSKGIRPTAAGGVFIDRLRHLLYEYKQAKRELWESEGMKGGRVTMGISSFRGQQTLPKILRLFARQYPDVHVDVVEAHSLKLEDLLLEGKVDVAVVALPAAKLRNEAVPLTKDEIYLVANAGHPLGQKATPGPDGVPWIRLEDAAEYPFVLSYHDTILGTTARNLFQKHKLKVEAEHDNISAAMAVSMAKAGVGLAFTYSSCVDPDDQIQLFRIGEEGVFLDLGVARPWRPWSAKSTGRKTADPRAARGRIVTGVTVLIRRSHNM